MSNFFQFESDFVESLRCIPMQMRLKLDTCGVKLKLAHWHQFSEAERLLLVQLPCDSEAEIQAYGDRLQQLVRNHTGSAAGCLPVDPFPAWLDGSVIPDTVQQKAQEVAVAIAPEQWATLTLLQRFALIKLSRPSHENHNFVPALKEFHLM